MKWSTWEDESFIRAPTVEELLKALTGETSEIQLEADIRLDAALAALRDGFSLTRIVQQTVYQLEKYIICQVLQTANGNKAETARILKIDYKTLYRKMYKYFGTFPDFLPAGCPDGYGSSMTLHTGRKSVDSN